jgi:hypothetical protein
MMLLPRSQSRRESGVRLLCPTQPLPVTRLNLFVKGADGVDGEPLEGPVGDEERELADGQAGFGDVETRVGAEQGAPGVE